MMLQNRAPEHQAGKRKLRIRGELALCLTAVNNSFAVCLMLHSRGGITPISAVPYILSEVFPVLSLGAWTYGFQTLLVATLVLLRLRQTQYKKAVVYLFSFLVAGLFSFMMDVHALWVNQLPQTLPLCFLYFVISFFVLAFGITLSNHCKMPVIPTDLFPRELSVITTRSYKVIKTVFDLACLAVTLCLSVYFLHQIQGIGIGTVVCAFTLGKTISVMGSWLTKHVEFVSFLEPEGPAETPDSQKMEA